MKYRNLFFLLLALALTTATLHGQSNVAVSNIFPLDTRLGATITGQVVDGTPPVGPYLPLSGATVTVGESSATTGSNGRFEIKAMLASALPLAITAEGFARFTQAIGPAQTGKVIDLGLITLKTGNGPIVEWVRLEPEWNFLHGRGLFTEVVAKVNWNGVNPRFVELRSGGALLDALETTRTEVRFLLDIDDTFPRGYTRGLDLRVKAVGETTSSPRSLVESKEAITTIYVFPWPNFLAPLIADSSRNRDEIALDFSLGTKQSTVTLPVVGRFGYQFGLGGSFDYSLIDGSWETALGSTVSGNAGKRGRRPKIPGFTTYDGLRLYVGNRELKTEFFARTRGTALPGRGIDVSEISGGLSLSARLELSRYGLLDIVGPGLTTAVREVVGEPFVRNFSVRLDLLPEITGEAVFAPRWPLEFKQARVDLALGLEAVYNPTLAGQSAKVYVGGRAAGTFGLPEPIFRQVNFRAYAGVEVEAWVFDVKGEYVFLNYTYPSRRLPLNALPIEGGYLLPAAANDDGWSVMARPWREAGAETFLLAPAAPGRRLSAEAEDALTRQEIFARMGAAPSPGAIYQPTPGPGRRLISDPDLPAQTELPLLTNVFPNSKPTLADVEGLTLLLYVRDTGAANPAQFTEVAWTLTDGTSFSPPEPLGTDPRAQFAPQVAFDGNYNAIAIFERIKDASYGGSDLKQFAGLMEIVWSRFDFETFTWSTPEPLTNNAFLDFQPQLAGPLDNGDLIATWVESPSNELDGTAEHPHRVMTARWDAASGAWGTPTVLLERAVGLLGSDLAAGGSRALFVWSADGDGDLTDTTDSELRYRLFENGAWGAEVRHTSDAVADRNPQAWVDASGKVFFVWNRGAQLVLSQDFGLPSVARSAADSLGVADFALTGGPAGNLVLIWQEMSENGSDAHYRVYDPASQSWGLDTLLSADRDLERSFAPVWDAAGNLTIAYNNVTITTETVSVEVEGGEIIEVEGVPQQGRVDLMVAKRALVRDLEIVPDSLSAEGLSFLPGDVVTLKATVRNSGNEPVFFPVARFYDGDPAEGGTQIHQENFATVTIDPASGEITFISTLAANESREITYAWTLPSPATAHEVFVVVDPDGTVTEFSEDNNRASMIVGGIDLEVVYRSGDVLRDGSVRIVVDVENLGAPASPVTEVSLFDEAAPNTPLLTLALGAVAPSDRQTLVFELPAGSHAQGETIYRLVADAANLSGDLATDNNETRFALFLWIDDDADGLPEWWESANGLSDANRGDAALDPDGDGFTNYQEYLAGTDPRDGQSFLKLNAFNVLPLPGGTGGLRFSFSWASVDGALYDVQRSLDLATWTTVAEDVSATPPLNSFVDELPGVAPQRVFYRLVVR